MNFASMNLFQFSDFIKLRSFSFVIGLYITGMTLLQSQSSLGRLTFSSSSMNLFTDSILWCLKNLNCDLLQDQKSENSHFIQSQPVLIAQIHKFELLETIDSSHSRIYYFINLSFSTSCYYRGIVQVMILVSVALSALKGHF